MVSRRRHLRRKLTFATKYLINAEALISSAAAEYRAAQTGPYVALEAVAQAIREITLAVDNLMAEV
jgi:hypothetical protein